jgi:monoamine oxidase
VIKIYVLYRTNWWREQGLSGEMLSDEEPVTLYYDATCETKNALIGFIPAHLARKWGAVPADELKKAIVAQLVKEYGPSAASPHEILIRPWLHDDVWCRGAYSGSMPTNTLSKYGNILRSPCGRVHWAGTELATDWAGKHPAFRRAVLSLSRKGEKDTTRGQWSLDRGLQPRCSPSLLARRSSELHLQ